MKKNIRKIRVFLWAGLFALVFWLFWMAIVPSGKIVYINSFGKKNEFIQKFTPQERILLDSRSSVKIIGEPVYFSLRTPRVFEKARFTIKYKNNSDFSIIEIGPLVDKNLWRYRLKPIENKILDRLSFNWEKTREGDLLLLQRKDLPEDLKFDSIDKFLNNLPMAEKIAVYNYKLEYEYIMEDYKSTEEERILDYPLRGNFSFYTYIKDEDLFFDFEITDINQNKDEDSVSLFLYYQNQLIDSLYLEDDGISEDSSKKTEARNLKIKSIGLPEGVYKIEIKANNDIITEKIKTIQSKIAFLNKIWLHSGDKEDLKIFTDSRNINAQTINPGSLQKIKIGNQELEIGETYKIFSIGSDAGTKEIILEKDDVILSGNGMFSFFEEDFFNPKIKGLDSSLDLDAEGVDYVLAEYREPEEIGEWRVTEVDFDIAEAYREFYKNSFLISVLGLRADDDIDDYIEIDEIRVELRGRSLWGKIKKIISK